jgi:polysaccharide deacetylase family protein (PEP-CTERM system associated)
MSEHLLSIDLEDWFTSGHLRHYVKPGEIVSRIEATTYPILELLDRKNTKATFFVLGSVARDKPRLIADIYKAGHEVASHGFSHTPLWELTPESFRKEILETNDVLSNITGAEIKGFRAPYCSLDNSTRWAIPVLIEEGFRYDSSIFPMKTPRYGVKGASVNMYFISEQDVLLEDEERKLLEIPFTIYDNKILNIPCTGGIYARYLPLSLLQYFLKKVAQQRPLNFYCHPWETDAEMPKVSVPFYNKMVVYYNNSSYLTKIEALTSLFSFTSFERLLAKKGMLRA